MCCLGFLAGCTGSDGSSPRAQEEFANISSDPLKAIEKAFSPSKKVAPKKAHILLIPGLLDTIFFDERGDNTWFNLEKIAVSSVHSLTDLVENEIDNMVRKHVVGEFDGKGGLNPLFNDTKPFIPFGGLPVSQAENMGVCKNNKLEGGLCGIAFRSDIGIGVNLPGMETLFSKMFHSTALENFSTMIVALREKGYEPGVNLWGFPYDWRESVRYENTQNRLDELLKNISKDGKEKVIIFAHSLGNLVTKAYLNKNAENFEKYVSDWVAVAPPFQGSAGTAIPSVLNGEHKSFKTFCEGTTAAMSSKVLTFYELLPTKWWEDKYGFELSINGPQRNQILSSVEAFTSFVVEGRKNATLEFDDQSKKIAVEPDLIAWAKETRESLQKSTFPDSATMHIVYGTGIDTKYKANITTTKADWAPEDITCVSTANPQNKCSNIPLCVTQAFTTLDGDGDVPVTSALSPFAKISPDPKNLEKLEISGVKHQALVNDKKVIDYLLRLAQSKEN